MANRLFELPETKGVFQIVGIVNGVENGKFYSVKKTKTGKDMRIVNFGCEYDERKSLYMNLTGMPQPYVYFSKKDKKTNKKDTQPVAWANRNKFNEDGYRMIGVNLGLEKIVDNEGNIVNDKKLMHQFDACEYISEHLQDDTSVFIRGDVNFESFMDGNGDIVRRVKYVPNQISLCKDVDFSEYNENRPPKHNFTQTIVFMGIEEEIIDGEITGRYVVSAKIVTYSDIVDTQFIIDDKSLANLFKRNLKPYTAIEVFGCIDAVHVVVESTGGWGKKNSMRSVNSPVKFEMVIEGAEPSTIDRDTYTEKDVAEAIRKIRTAQTAEQNFSGKSVVDASKATWGKQYDSSNDDEYDEEWG